MSTTERVRIYFTDALNIVRNTLTPLQPQRHNERIKALLCVALISFLWGTTWLASKKGVEHMPAMQLAGIRQLLGGSLYVLFFFLRKYPLPNRAQFVQFLWMSVLMFVLTNGLSTWSVKYLPSGLGAVIAATTPLWIAVFSILFFRGSAFNARTTIGLLLGFGGIVIIFYDYLHELLNSAFSFGILLGIVASMTWALGTIFTTRHAQKLDPYYSLGWQMFIGGFMLLFIAYISGEHIPIQNAHINTWQSIAYLVVFGSVISFAAFIYSIKRLPAAQASVYAYINPIVAVIIGTLLNGEKLTEFVVIGTLVTIIGVYLVNVGFKKSETQKSQ